MTSAPRYRNKILAASAVLACLLAGAVFAVAAPRGNGSFRAMSAPANFGGNYGYGYSPYFGGFGGVYLPFGGTPALASGYSNLPPYWWTGYYETTDPRGVGYNPDAGYDWDSVTTLLLETFPLKARVTLDGVFVGTSDRLGPFQLPTGEHTLRIDAAGYEPSETVLKIVKPVVQELMVRLNAVVNTGKPAPRP